MTAFQPGLEIMRCLPRHILDSLGRLRHPSNACMPGDKYFDQISSVL